MASWVLVNIVSGDVLLPDPMLTWYFNHLVLNNLENKTHIILVAADALAPYVARSSAIITWTNANLLITGPLETEFKEIFYQNTSRFIEEKWI